MVFFLFSNVICCFIPLSLFQFTVVVMYCDVIFLFFAFVCKSFAIDKELYQYDLRSPHLPDYIFSW